MKLKIATLLIACVFLSCEKDEDSNTPGQTNLVDPGIVMDNFSVDYENHYEPFVGLISRNTCGVCGQSGHPNFDQYLYENLNVNGTSFNYSSSDPLYHPEANDFAAFMNLSATPSYTQSVVNFSSSLDPWKSSTNDAATTSPAALMAMYGSLAKQDSFTITTRIVPQTEQAFEDVRFTVYLQENNVISPQTDYGASPTTVPDYIHNHVFRGSSAGIFGTSVKANYTSSDTLEIVHGFSIPSFVNSENIVFIGVLYVADASGKPTGVIQSQRLNRN